MKHNYLMKIMALAAIVAAACSCDQVESRSGVLNHVGIRIGHIDTQDFGTDTKGLEINSLGFLQHWSSEDIVGMFPDRGAQAYFEMAGQTDEETAEFDGGGWALKTANVYAVYYPYDYDNVNRYSIAFDYNGQHQQGNGNYSHLDQYQFMACGSQKPVEGTCNFEMTLIETVVRFTLTIPTPASLVDFSIKIDGEKEMVTGTSLDISEEEFTITPRVTERKLAMTLGDVWTSEDNEQVVIYLMVPPQDLSEDTLIISVNTSDGDCLQGKVAGKNLVHNHAVAFAVDMTSDHGSYYEDFGSEGGSWTSNE